MRKLFQCAAMLLALHCGFAHAQPPPPNPEIAISSCEELQDINNNLSGNYYLANDIDCAGFDFGDGKGFMPIGNATAAFTGNFDGKGFTISNVSINRPDQTYYVGLFGFAGWKDGTASIAISHVNLTGLDINGNSHVGGLFGQLYYGDVTDVHAEGTVRGVGVIGNLGGSSRYSTITNATSSGSVEGDHSGNLSLIFYGGLLGSNERGSLSCSSSSVDVVGNYRVGGLVGHNSGNLSTSFATGTVQGVYRVGGLAGENISGSISDCFATGDVSGFSGSHELGGLVGLQSNAAIKNSYATGSVTGGVVNMNGILGLLYSSSTCADNYWDVTTSGVSTDGCGSSGRTTAEMQTQSTFVGWDFTQTWTMNGYPKLQCVPTPSVQHTVMPSAGTGGTITPDSPQAVSQGSTASFTVLADSGYKIENVEGCGGTLSGNTYTTAPVTEDCSVTASFMPHPSRNGMTWGINKYIAELDITRVHCYGQVGPNRGPCDPYQGDTSCSAALPLLCVKVDGTPRPAYALATCSSCAMSDEYYNGWAEGSIGLTAPAQGNAFASLADADAYCAAQLGEGYKVAEHHTGRYVMGMNENNFYGDTWPTNTSAGGWGLYGPGQLADTSRFWVDINDQDANCWGRDPSSRYSVTPSAGTGGSINPDTPQSVDYGQTTSFTVTPETGYSIDKVEGCGGTLNGSTYTTGAITADCAVTATFVSSTTYTVIPRAGRHGSISPSAPQQVRQGTAASFTVTPDAGWQIKRVRGCGGTLSGSIYTTAPASRDCTVKARFERIPRHTVTTEVNGRGSISPRRPQRVIEGNAVSFTVTPDAGWQIKRVRGCGGTLNGSAYTTGPVRRDCTVRASFDRK